MCANPSSTSSNPAGTQPRQQGGSKQSNPANSSASPLGVSSSAEGRAAVEAKTEEQTKAEKLKAAAAMPRPEGRAGLEAAGGRPRGVSTAPRRLDCILVMPIGAGEEQYRGTDAAGGRGPFSSSNRRQRPAVAGAAAAAAGRRFWPLLHNAVAAPSRLGAGRLCHPRGP